MPHKCSGQEGWRQNPAQSQKQQHHIGRKADPLKSQRIREDEEVCGGTLAHSWPRSFGSEELSHLQV